MKAVIIYNSGATKIIHIPRYLDIYTEVEFIADPFGNMNYYRVTRQFKGDLVFDEHMAVYLEFDARVINEFELEGNL